MDVKMRRKKPRLDVQSYCHNHVPHRTPSGSHDPDQTTAKTHSSFSKHYEELCVLGRAPPGANAKAYEASMVDPISTSPQKQVRGAKKRTDERKARDLRA
ncbi:hypothetical protein MKZ38_010273 [Zalerion maritima]|uniref:Uncharacterized protein n=1 Tax=Zalerion maritima TaxID=339359 RepID=A0AAD5RFY9_9PEZI|nr:hypothetical protein MKZ38_010273 [Zalerion maritima]